VQAAAAEDAFDDPPDEARAALGSIERAGRDAARDSRLLRAVRPGTRVAGSRARPEDRNAISDKPHAFGP
jgi:hypothetical protein